jgi:hypothetical protein
MNRQAKKNSGNWSALWLVLGFLVVMGWRGWVRASQYLHEPRAIREICNLRQFEQDLSPNSANTRLVFCQDTEEGVGIYFCDTTGGKPRLLGEEKEKGRKGRRFTMLGWSPDDSRFACAFPENKRDQELILIFDGRTGEPVGKLVADPSLRLFGWLANDSFAYSVGGRSVRMAARQANGDWVHQRFFENVATNMDNFTAITADSVAWRDKEGIGLLHLDSGLAERIWEAATNRLMEFTYDRATGEYLLNCDDAAGQYLLLFRPAERRQINLGPISQHHAYIRHVTWNKNHCSYVCLTNDLAGSAFCVKTGELAKPTIIPWRGGIHSCALNGNHLFFSGNPDDQAPSLWDYDLQSGIFKCIASSTGGPLERRFGSPSVSQAMTNSLGEQQFYHLWAPPHFSPDRKYPVLLAQELNDWFPCFPIAAQCGYFVAVVDRPFFKTWDGEPQQSWIEDVSRLQEIMAKNPNIDTSRVYLCACSRETFFLSQMLNERPALAEGAILFSPVAFPDVSSVSNKCLFLVDGKADGDASKQLMAFQEHAAKKGYGITVFLQANAGHNPAAGATIRNRNWQFAQFISEHR